MLRVDDSQFQSWVRNVKIKVREGLFDTLIDAGLLIRTRTTPYVPLDKGYLEGLMSRRLHFNQSFQNGIWLLSPQQPLQ
jgi:hypothetical protein